MPIKLTVNNQSHELDIDPNMPLLWAIRDHLRLTGTKFGCGMAVRRLYRTHRWAGSSLVCHSRVRGRGQEHHDHRGAGLAFG
jgi:hypothetical protein